MGYIYDFDIGSMLFFGLTIFFYLYQKRLRNLQDSIFTTMLFCSLIAIVFDFAAAAMEYHAMEHPVWLLYAVNILFIFGMQTCLPMFFLYSVASAGKFNKLSGWKLFACAIPYIVTMILLLISPFTDLGMCYIDAAHIYRHGPTHGVLYVNMGLYVLAGIAVLLRNGRSISKGQRNVILLFAAILFLAMVLQLVFPRYLLTASATALSLTAVFYTLQSPVDQVNPLTGAFSRTLLPSLLQDLSERGRPYTLLLFSIRDFDELVRLYGDDGGDLLLHAFSEHLIKGYPDCQVVYMDTPDFTVVHSGVLSPEKVEDIARSAPGSIAAGSLGEVRLEICLGAVPCSQGDDITVADYVLKDMYAAGRSGSLYADDAYRRACMATLGLEASLGRLFAEGGMTTLITPMLNAYGAAAAFNAQLTVNGGEAGGVTPRQLLQAVGRSGLAREYYKTLMASLGQHSDMYGPDRRLCIPMIPAAFMQDDAPDRLLALVSSFGFRPEQLLLSVDESDIVESESVLADNIRGLFECGFAIMIDSFAEGSTDMSLVASLPLSFARLHECFARNAAQNPKHAKLLSGLVSVLRDIGITPVCPGVDTAAQRRAVLDAGAPLMQGAAAGLSHGQ